MPELLPIAQTTHGTDVAQPPNRWHCRDMSTFWKIVSIPVLALGFLVLAPFYIAAAVVNRAYYGDENESED